MNHGSPESKKSVGDIVISGGGVFIKASAMKESCKRLPRQQLEEAAHKLNAFIQEFTDKDSTRADHSVKDAASDEPDLEKCDIEEDSDDLGEYFPDVLPSPFERKMLPLYDVPEMSDDEDDGEIDATTGTCVRVMYASVSRV